MNYITLALARRFDDYESIGYLFKCIKDQLLEETLVERIWKLMKEIYTAVLAKLGVDWECFFKNLIHSFDVLEQLKQICNFSLILNQTAKPLDFSAMCET